MKTKEQIEEMAINYEAHCPHEGVDAQYCLCSSKDRDSFIAGYEQAQRDFQEREAKLVEPLKYYADQRSWKTESSIDDNSFIAVINDDDMYPDKDEAGRFYIGGKRARETLKELGVE